MVEFVDDQVCRWSSAADATWLHHLSLVLEVYYEKCTTTKYFPQGVLLPDINGLQGVQIQGTFWREQADQYEQVLQEGAVYVLSKFSVKPANKQFATVNNDYELHFNERCVWAVQMKMCVCVLWRKETLMLL